MNYRYKVNFKGGYHKIVTLNQPFGNYKHKGSGYNPTIKSVEELPLVRRPKRSSTFSFGGIRI